MHCVTADFAKRVRIADAKPKQVFSYNLNSDGSVLLVPVKAERKERFPPGSLLKYFTPEKNEEERQILAGCVQGPIGPDEDR